MEAAERPGIVIKDPGWSPGEAGTYAAGAFRVVDVASFLTRWSPEPTTDALNVADFDDGLCVPLLSGTWHARLFIQEEEVPARLQQELAGVSDARFLESVFAVAFRRTWLVLAHASVGVSVPPEPKAGAPTLVDLLALRDRAEEVAVDSVEGLPWIIRSGNDKHGLECVGRLEAWTHRIAFVAGDSLRPEMSRAFEQNVNESLYAWHWGLIYRCGRPAPVPIFAAGSPAARSILALPALRG